jgi:aldehyde dehydrogenase (NAD+)
VTDKVQVAGEQDVDRAVDAARAAYPAWRETAGHKRGAIMLKFADLLEQNAERLGKLESIAMGQPITVAKRMILGSVALWR